MPDFQSNDLKERVFDYSPMPIVIMDAQTYRYVECNSAAVRIYGYTAKDEVLGKSPLDVSAETQYDGTPSESKAGEYIKTGIEQGTVVFEWRHKRSNGELWDAEVHLFSFMLEGRPMIQFSLKDISEKKQQDRAQQLLHELILGLNLCTSLNEGLNLVLDYVLKEGCFDCGGVYIVDSIDSSLVLAVHRGLSEEYIALTSRYSADSENAHVAGTGEIRFGMYSDIPHANDPVRQKEGLRAFAIVPVMAGNKLVALMNLCSRLHGQIGEVTRKFIEAVACQIGGMLLRLRTGEALRKSEQILTAFLDSASDSFMIFDSGLRILAANKRIFTSLGLSHGELIGKSIPEIFPSEYLENHFRKFCEVLETGVPCGFEYSFLRQNADKRDYVVTLFKVGDGLGLAAHDITERKRAEEALRDSEEVFAAFMFNSPILAFIKEIEKDDSRTLQASNCFVDLIGKSGMDIRGKTTRELFPADFAEKIIIDDREVVAQNRVVQVDEDFQGRHYTSIKFPIKQKGRTLLAGYTIDVTEQKRAEASLQKEKEFVEKLMNGLPVIFYLYDANLRLRRWNRKHVELLGYNDDELNGISIETFLVNPEIVEMVKAGLTETITTNAYTEMEAPLKTKNGSLLNFLLSATRLDTDDGPMMMGVGLDITDRTRAEEHNEKLLERLNQVQKLEALGVLAGGIAHDFNNLLGGIFGYIDLARMDGTEQGKQRNLDKAVSAIERTRALTHQLLTFAKGGVPVKHPEYLDPFVQDTVRFALSGTAISSTFEIEPGLWHCEFDKNQIAQVIDNIVINAVQAMPNGGRLDVKLHNRVFNDNEHLPLRKGRYVEIAFKDEGAGIPREYLSRIFDPFYTTKPKGHGLGLSTCFSIVNRHDGCIDADSVPGQGSVFKVYLPALNSVPRESDTREKKQHFGKGKFLIMDDEEMIRDTLARMLEKFGYSVISTESGEQAIARYQQEGAARSEIKGMIFDLTIKGGMGGRKAVCEIRKIDPEIPVFVASGYADDPVMADPETYGFSASISKPFMCEEVEALLSEHLHRHKER